jgi:hypothetical protein
MPKTLEIDDLDAQRYQDEETTASDGEKKSSSTPWSKGTKPKVMRRKVNSKPKTG